MKGTKILKHLAFAFSAVTLSACMATTDSQPTDPFPANYRQIVADHLKSNLFDPYSVRNAQISEPRAHNAIAGPRWNVCFRGNAKNRLGGYTGMRDTLFVIQSGRIIATDDEYGSTTCAGATFGPFPELAG